ncbi:B-cell receptor-associated protein 31-like [Zingiber officinale]|uniref:B-cell receptor-associated protein 31-like n=1 Tax=Zingiber officinale TaxID=94328 RepID=UPI001C4D81E0|nr:B-cell receptor-associated protein 31-like [Zingiber officinale]
MIQLLFLVLFAEGAVALILIWKIGPLRELAMKGLDQLKIGKGPATMKTLACTMSVIFVSSITSILKIQNRGTKLGTVTPMDQVLWRTHLIEASLIGYTLFLALVIDRLHHYLRKLVNLRRTVHTSREEVENLKNENQKFKNKDATSSSKIKKLNEEVTKLKEKLQKVESESEEQGERARTAEAHVASLQKQSEELLLEYDRLLEDNQILQAQALSFKI